MRTLALLCPLLLVGCSTTNDAISPDTARDGGTKGDGGTNADGGLGDGGNDVDSGGIDTTSGSRLKAKFITGDDGSKFYTGLWYDSARSEDCSFAVASDGQRRCLPTLEAAGVAYFSDSGCSQAAALVQVGCGTKYASKSALNSAACPTYTTSLFPLGAQVSTSTLWFGTPASCFSQAIPAGDALYSFSATEIPPSSFVAGTDGHD